MDLIRLSNGMTLPVKKCKALPYAGCVNCDWEESFCIGCYYAHTIRAELNEKLKKEIEELDR